MIAFHNKTRGDVCAITAIARALHLYLFFIFSLALNDTMDL
jgi:hypothetical protein